MSLALSLSFSLAFAIASSYLSTLVANGFCILIVFFRDLLSKRLSYCVLEFFFHVQLALSENSVCVGSQAAGGH